MLNIKHPLECMQQKELNQLTVTAHSYLRHIIEPILIPKFHQYTPSSLFMENNVPPLHSGKIVTNGLQEVSASFGMMTSDLNPMEHV